ncbi:MAG: Oligosaccharyl transferase STT3 subunit [Candidatus Lokiarchaeum sp. GC14_75]|nr:MAG: Oligosaccharyl transferase STT3 subunit [Candidatus Lokiarchaeum sp. GC14_75]
MVKIFASLRNFNDRIRTSVSIKTRNILFFIAIFLVVVLAVMLRITPILRGPRLIKAFDPWIQWYNAEYLSEHSIFEYFKWRDYKSWYPQGFNRANLRPGLTFTVVAIHKFLTFIGLNISLYDICFFFPAFMGGLTVLVIYFLGKEVLDRGTGLVAAFFLAFNPGFAQRTMAGFFDNETIGVFATLLAFLFLLKAMRTGKILHGLIGGLALGYLSLSWGGFEFVFLVIPILSIILVFTDKFNQNILIAYAMVEGVGLLIFSLYNGFSYDLLFSDLKIGGIFLFTIVLTIFHIIKNKREEYPSLYQNLINIIKWGFIPAVIFVAFVVWVAPDLIPFGFGARFQTILNPLYRGEISLIASVAEQMPSPWSVFYYNTLIPLILTPLGIYFCFKRLNAPEIFLILFVLFMFYFTGSMIRIILMFAPAVSIVGAYGLVSILKIYGSFLGEKKVGVSKKRRRQLKGTIGSSEVIAIFFVAGFLGIAQIVHSTNISIEQLSYSQISPGGVLHDWEESLVWMRSNLEGTEVVVSWWDYGYWLTPIGNVTTVNDNATMNQTRIGLTGMALMQTDEILSAKAFRALKADYVLVYFGLLINGLGGDEGKWPWMVKICNDNYAKYIKMGLEEDNWAEDSVFIEDEYQNASTGKMGAKWFQSQLVKLMFFGTPTNPDEVDQNDIRRTYVNRIHSQEVTEGGVWKDYIPDNGLYESKVFIPEYFSNLGLVKLYKIDYTVLESRFFITEAEVYDSGYATFKIKNTGTKDLLISDVDINGINYDFAMGDNINRTLKAGDSNLVWVNIGGSSFQKDDVIKINVSARSEALEGRVYDFSNNTENFFVKGAQQGSININRKNSKVIQKNASTSDIFLEVENTGSTIEYLDRFYVNNDTDEKRVPLVNTEFLSGSRILEPGDKAYVHLSQITTSFLPIRTFNKIGVATPYDIRDELLFSSTLENFSLSILNYERILSPENFATIKDDYRKHIPIDLNMTSAVTYPNGTTILKIKVKNTGDIIFGIDSVYLTESLLEVDFDDFVYNPGLLDENEEDFLIIDATTYINSEVNEEILVSITGNFDILGTVTSDIGYIHTIKNEEDIKIIQSVEGITTSFIYANETGRLLIKNTGNKPITIDNIYFNETSASDIEYTFGSSSLDIQECAVVSFNIPDLAINDSDDVVINITTTSTAQTVETYNAFVDPIYYNITIDDGATIDAENLTLILYNSGKFNVTLNSIFINDTYIASSTFYENFVEVGAGDSIYLPLNVSALELIFGAINVNDEFVIIVRSEEGAEISHQVVIIP